MSLKIKSNNNNSPFLSSFASLQVLLILAIWLGFVAWRPFVFGFYHDDWSSVAMPLDRAPSLADLLTADPTRPLYILIIYGMRMILGDNYFAWQAISALLQLFCSMGIFYASSYILKSLANAERDELRWCAAVSAVLWLIFPWSLGYSAWPVMLPPLLGMLIAICGIIFALKPDANLCSLIVSISLFVISWFIYEATWFIWVSIALILAIRKSSERKYSLRLGAQFFCIGLITQVSFIVLNRTLSTQSHHAKKFSEGIVPTLGTDIHLIEHQLIPSLAGNHYFVISGLFVLAACALINLRQRERLFRGVAVLAFVGVGLCLSITLYAAAGYAIEWIGLFSRVTLPISLWLAFAVCCLFSLAWLNAAKLVRYLAVLAIFAVCIPLAVSLFKQSLSWRKAWIEQQEILHALPDSVVNLANRKSVLLMDVPRGTAPVYTFSAYWDISGAITPRISNWEYAEVNKPYPFATVLRIGEWRTTWNGKVVKQFWCDSPESSLWELAAERVYIWKYPAQTATSISAPYDSGCKMN